ncbi:uncharacterized protein LOC126738566 [Anthonomus grandis grandis]|uniref:uncharacterized protein LOC126738566 n=1 Tax=Anthonomus grandis grandis TaxID=2921223 RepID=UPI002166B2AF|nr:uncharacterized protein LOC126738566 [Anthonomus grandis grandis]XP_050299912.1 uncharacterized protein LOC126738566 [Anthonomus grandis grandis]XP_050299913.1 uncharacterized protein LOC126738566 [Anthonomus grandis grandis]XP_050299915.1 uncharacterized protein LOC126738566 [Anthonomus grandis grandis]XP_050299916.1 uncharacterized protein LOC126738566 [Anthonomus grandis grandis]
MLIALRIQTLVAFFGLAAICQTARPEEEDYFNETSSYEHEVERRSPRGNRHRHQPRLDDHLLFHGRYYPYYHEVELKYPPGQVLLLKQNKQLLEHEYEMMKESGPGVDCCPSVLEVIEPKGGKNDQGNYVDLYESETYKQRFYELSCHKDVLDKPCRFMDKKLHPLSRCVQMHSYTYALIKDTSKKSKSRNMPTLSGVDRSGNATYTLDYISIRSGCSCVVMPPKKKKKHKVHKMNNNEVKNHHKNNKKKSGIVYPNNNQMSVLREPMLDEDYR